MLNKRGQGLSTNAIILIILGVVVLVILIIGFTLGWGTLKDRITGGGNNVDDVVQECSSACATLSRYSYCSAKKELKTEDETLTNVTCYYLAEKQPQYGIEKCSALSCDYVFVDVDVNEGETIEDKCKDNEENAIQALKGETIQALIDNELISHDCPAQSETAE